MARRLFLCWVVGWLLVPASGAQMGAGRSHWWSEVERVDQLLRKGKWKGARREARKVADDVIGTSWFGTELAEVLAELSFFQAAAAANLGDVDEAKWWWFAAQNLSFKIWRKDLSPYGDAEGLLREFPLRKLGEVPAGFEVLRGPIVGGDFTHPVKPEMPTPRILNNTAAVQEGPGNLQLEIIIDKKGRIRHPVVIDTNLNPIMIYAVLKAIPTFPHYQPAIYNGAPVDFIVGLRVQFIVVRWYEEGSLPPNIGR